MSKKKNRKKRTSGGAHTAPAGATVTAKRAKVPSSLTEAPDGEAVPLGGDLPVQPELPPEPAAEPDRAVQPEPESPVERESPAEPELPAEAEFSAEPELPAEAESPAQPELPAEEKKQPDAAKEPAAELLSALPPEPKHMRARHQEMKPRKKKKHLGFLAFVTFTFVFASASAAFVFLLFNFSGSTLFASPDEVDLPNFFGMELADVKGNPEYASFNFIVEEEYSLDYDEGVIFAQSPKAPKTVKENAVITLRVSKGIQRVEVPAVADLTLDEAKTELDEAGLAVVVRYVEDEDVKDGYAIRTDPEKGDVVQGGSTVTLFVAREDNYVHVTVPNVVGKGEESARKALEAAGFSVSVVEKESSKTAGTVISMAPSGTALQGSTITITVAKGNLTLSGGDHMHNLVATQVIPPTPNGYGYTVYTCDICGFVTYGDQIPPTG